MTLTLPPGNACLWFLRIILFVLWLLILTLNSRRSRDPRMSKRSCWSTWSWWTCWSSGTGSYTSWSRWTGFTSGAGCSATATRAADTPESSRTGCSSITWRSTRTYNICNISLHTHTHTVLYNVFICGTGIASASPVVPVASVSPAGSRDVSSTVASSTSTRRPTSLDPRGPLQHRSWVCSLYCAQDSSLCVSIKTLLYHTESGKWKLA